MFSSAELEITPESSAVHLLEQFWQPVCLASDVSQSGDRFKISILGRPVVIARTNSGKMICIDEHCPHRGASMYYGLIEGENIRCAYHGWLFDSNGNCVERPFEASKEVINDCTHGYPAIEKYGLIFIYFGKNSIPPIPQYDVLERPGYSVIARRHEAIKCNWLHIQENAADLTHTEFLHGALNVKYTGVDQTGFSNKLETYGFQPKIDAIIKTWSYKKENGQTIFGFGNPLVFPNQLVLETEVHWRVPLSHEQTIIFIVSIVEENFQVDECFVEIKFKNSDGTYDLSKPFGQDAMALETGFDIKKERLGVSDYGILIFRNIIRDMLLRSKKNNLHEEILGKEFNGLRKYKNYMGGFLPSTGIVKGIDNDNNEDYFHKHVKDENYKEFISKR